MASGQKKLRLMGIFMSMKSPFFTSCLKTKFVSGCISVICFLNALESIANNSLSINLRILLLSVSPSTDIITCFNVVVNVALRFNLAKPSMDV